MLVLSARELSIIAPVEVMRWRVSLLPPSYCSWKWVFRNRVRKVLKWVWVLPPGTATGAVCYERPMGKIESENQVNNKAKCSYEFIRNLCRTKFPMHRTHFLLIVDWMVYHTEWENHHAWVMLKIPSHPIPCWMLLKGRLLMCLIQTTHTCWIMGNTHQFTFVPHKLGSLQIILFHYSGIRTHPQLAKSTLYTAMCQHFNICVSFNQK